MFCIFSLSRTIWSIRTKCVLIQELPRDKKTRLDSGSPNYLRPILNYHIAEGRITSAQFKADLLVPTRYSGHLLRINKYSSRVSFMVLIMPTYFIKLVYPFNLVYWLSWLTYYIPSYSIIVSSNHNPFWEGYNLLRSFMNTCTSNASLRVNNKSLNFLAKKLVSWYICGCFCRLKQWTVLYCKGKIKRQIMEWFTS